MPDVKLPFKIVVKATATNTPAPKPEEKKEG